MFRIRLLFFVLILNSLFVNAQNKFNYVGALKLNDTVIISYKVNFIQFGEEVKGYSITDLGGDHETRSNVFGEYDKQAKVLSFRETGIVYTKSSASQNDFCFLNTTFKNFVFGKTQKARANFIGLFSDNTKCIDGEIVLNTEEKAEKRVEKVVAKINKSKILADSLKEKLKSVKLMDVLKMNMLKKNETLSVFTKSKKIKCIIYDGGKLDGDRLSIKVNGEVVLDNYAAVREEKVIAIDIKTDITSILIEANNEGEIAPNTVVVKLNDGVNEIRALSNLKKGETTQINILKQR